VSRSVQDRAGVAAVAQEVVLDTIAVDDSTVPEELRGCRVVERQAADGTSRVYYVNGIDFCIEEEKAEFLISAHRIERDELSKTQRAGVGKSPPAGYGAPARVAQRAGRLSLDRQARAQPVTPPPRASQPPPRAQRPAKAQAQAQEQARPRPQSPAPASQPVSHPPCGEVLDQLPDDDSVPRKLRKALLVNREGAFFYLTAAGVFVPKEEAEDWLEVWEKSHAGKQSPKEPEPAAFRSAGSQKPLPTRASAPAQQPLQEAHPKDPKTAWGVTDGPRQPARPPSAEIEDPWIEALQKAGIETPDALAGEPEKAARTPVPAQPETSSPAAKEKVAAPGIQKKTAAPAAQEKTAAPTAQEKTAAPAAQEKTAAPTAQEKTAAPTAQEKTAAPAAQEKTAAPTAQEKTAAPAAQEKTAAPATHEEVGTSPPRQAGAVSSPSGSRARWVTGGLHTTPGIPPALLEQNRVSFRKLINAAEQLRKDVLTGAWKLPTGGVKSDRLIEEWEAALLERHPDERIERVLRHSAAARDQLMEDWQKPPKGVDRNLRRDLKTGDQVTVVLNPAWLDEFDFLHLVTLLRMRAVQIKRDVVLRDLARQVHNMALTDLNNYLMTKSFVDELTWKIGSEDEMVSSGQVSWAKLHGFVVEQLQARLVESLDEVFGQVEKRHKAALDQLKPLILNQFKPLVEALVERLVALA
jgi:hypothetical protein